MENRKAAAAFGLLTVLFFLDHLLRGAGAPVRFHDVFDSEFGRFFHYGRDLLRDGFSTWWPALAGGMPTHAAHHGPLYPLNVLTVWLTPWVVYRGLTLAEFALAGWGMYRMIREVLGRPVRIAALGGLAFALVTQVGWKGLVVSYFVHLFPLFYVLLERLPAPGEPGRRRSMAGLAAILVLSYPILTVHFAIPHLLILWFVDPAPDRLRRVGRALLVWGGFALLNAPCLVSLIRYLPFAHRTPAAYAPVPLAEVPGLLQQALVDLFWAPRFHTVITSVVLLTPWVLRRSTQVRRLAAILAVSVPVVLLDSPKLRWMISGTFLWRLELRHLDLTLMAVATLLAAAVLAEFRELPPARQRAGLAFALVGTVADLVWVRVRAGEGMPIQWFLVLQLASLLALAALWMRVPRPEGSAEAPLAIALRKVVGGLALLGLLASTRIHRALLERFPYATAVPPLTELRALAEDPPDGPVRVGGIDIHPLVLQVRGMETIGGRSPLFFGPYKDLFGLVLRPQLQTPEARRFFADYWYNLLLSEETATSIRGPRQGEAFHMPLMGAMNTRYLVAHEPREDMTGLREVTRIPAQGGGEAITLYELERWLPRAYVVPRAQVLEDADAVEAALLAADFEALAGTAYLERGATPGEPPVGSWEPGAATARVTRYEADTVVVEAEVPGPGLLVVSSNWHPGWSYRRDQEEGAPWRVNRAFMAIPLPAAGTHAVELRHQDTLLVWLYLLQLLGAGVALAALVRVRPAAP